MKHTNNKQKSNKINIFLEKFLYILISGELPKSFVKEVTLPSQNKNTKSLLFGIEDYISDVDNDLSFKKGL